MDAHNLVQHLTPYLPYLLRLGEETAKAIVKKVGEDGWQKSKDAASGLWEKIHPTAKDDVKLIKAAKDVAEAQEALSVLPEHADISGASEDLSSYQDVLIRRFEAFLAANPDLATVAQTTIKQFVEIEGEAGKIHLIAKREGNVDQTTLVKKGAKSGDITLEA